MGGATANAAAPAQPIVTGTVGVDVSPLGLATGGAPQSVTVDNAKVTLHFDKDNNIIDQLPKPKSGNKGSKTPDIHVKGAAVHFVQEGKPDFHATGIDVKVIDSGEKYVVSGAVNDKLYGAWKIAGEWGSDGKAGAVNLDSDGPVHVTPDKLKALPFVPREVWDTVELDGTAPIKVKVGRDANEKWFWHIDADVSNTKTTIFPIDLALSDVSGKLAVDGAKVTITGMRGKAADGAITADANMDFGPMPARIEVKVGAKSLDVKKTPTSWGLASRVDEGRLNGSGDITLLLADGKVQPRGTGRAVIKGKLLGGDAEVEVYLEGDGQRLKFTDAPTKSSRRGNDTRTADPLAVAAMLTALLLQQPTPATAEKKTLIPEYVRANLKLKDVDIAELLKRANVDPGAKIAGKVTLELAAEIPTSNPRAVKLYRATGKVSTPTLQIEGLTLSGVTADAQLKDGVLTLTRLAADFPKGPDGKHSGFVGTATFGIDPRTNLTADLKLDNIPLDQVFAALPGYAGKAAGNLSGSFDLKIPGDKLSDLSTYVANGNLNSTGLMVFGQHADKVSVVLALKNGVAALTKAEIGIYKGTVAGEARVPLAGAEKGMVNVAVKNVDVAALGKDIGANAGLKLSGQINGNVTAEIPAGNPQAIKLYHGTAKVRTSTIEIEGLTLSGLVLDAQLNDGVLSLSRLAVDFPKGVDGKHAGLVGTAKFGIDPRTDLTANLSLDNLPLDQIFSAVPSLSGKAAGILSGAFDLKIPGDKLSDLSTYVMNGKLTSTGITLFGQHADRVSVVLALKNGLATLNKVEADIYKGTITGDGKIAVAGNEQGAVHITFKDVDAGAMSRAIPNSPVKMEGQFSGKLDGTLPSAQNFDATKITSQLDLEAPQLVVQGVPTSKLKGKIGYKPGAITYDLKGDAFGGTFDVDGTYPLTDEANKDKKDNNAAPAGADKQGAGTVKIEGIRLGRVGKALRMTSLDPLRGVVNLTLNYTLGANGPNGKGKLEIRGLAWGEGGTQTNILGDIIVTPAGVEIPALNGNVAGGNLRGNVRYDFGKPYRRYVSLVLENADAAALLLPFGVSGASGNISAKAQSSLGREINGAGTISAESAKIGGIDVTDLNIPISWSFAPGGGAQVNVTEARGTLARGRVTGKSELNWGESLQAKGSINFLNVNVSSLAESFGSSSHGVGRTTGKFEFSGTNIRSANDLTGTITAAFGEASVRELPVLANISPFLSPVQAFTKFQKGNLLARLGGGQVRIERLAMTSSAAKLFADGSVGLNGKLDLSVVYNTQTIGASAPVLNLVAKNIPAIGPIPVGLIVTVTEALSNRVVRLQIGGTTKDPTVRINPARLLGENAVRFFVGQFVPLPPPAE
ncbi:hypothetical protein FRUB_09617 [Fimbriiglobus ruber]|uniref:Uncharacterized protein n=2 Tax=Fimbriiglobus ruber TaxID=1908690 RepID=A0A225DEF2_9BACT|nr:hypothetical protein FRUB_09617 [Fimbriiglobus ruber]